MMVFKADYILCSNFIPGVNKCFANKNIEDEIFKEHSQLLSDDAMTMCIFIILIVKQQHLSGKYVTRETITFNVFTFKDPRLFV